MLRRRIILTWHTTAQGGAEQSVPELATHLAHLGVSVHVVWWRMGGPHYPGPGRMNVTEVNDWEEYRSTLNYLTMEAGTVVISSHRTAAVDVLLSNSAPVLATLRCIIDPVQPVRVVDPATGKLVESCHQDWPWPVLSGIASWVGISRAVADSARRAFPSGTPVGAIPDGVSIPDVAPHAARQADAGPFRIAAVARTASWKRVDELVRAVADPRLAPHVQLDVYGAAGSQDTEVRCLAQGLGAPVSFNGWVKNLSGELAKHHVLATAAHLEGFGRCVVDAAGAGIPAIVPSSGASPEVVLNGLTGLVYDHTTPDGLTNALLDALRGGRLRLVRMGLSARALADAWYRPERCAAQYLQLAHQYNARLTMGR
jgi:glycosyltransferase involved in cell wall biosynthesis